MSRNVYVDNSATTKVSDQVFEGMLPYLKEGYGNPSSIYSLGREAKTAIEAAREQIATSLNVTPREIYFTGCGSESNNWAIRGVAKKYEKLGKNHIITTAFEHHAVLHTVEKLEREGFDVTYIKPDSKGIINPQDIKFAIKDTTSLVSVMFVNNELGTIQPIKEIAAVCKQAKVAFHTDAVQAIGNIDVDIKDLGVDLFSLSGHKIHAPKGVGALYIRKGLTIENFMEGGAQERGRRAGTENVASIVGLSIAVKDAVGNVKNKQKHLLPLRDKLTSELLKMSHTRLNGHATKRLAGVVNFSFEGVEGEALLLLLDMYGIAASSGSACTSGSLDPSHVLLSIGLPHAIAHGSLRISLGDFNDEGDVDYIIESIPKIVERLRNMSPVWEKIMAGEEVI